MPAILLWTVGAVGVLAAAKWIMRESRRINAELHPDRYGEPAASRSASPNGRLRRDASGVYRPE
jgi:hypothetical protein